MGYPIFRQTRLSEGSWDFHGKLLYFFNRSYYWQLKYPGTGVPMEAQIHGPKNGFPPAALSTNAGFV
jgi:hypothetical protein